MKIAFLTTQINLKTGGGSNLSPHLKACSMAEIGHEVTMFTFFPEKNSFPQPPPYSTIELPTKSKNWLALQAKIFFVLRRYEKYFDIFAFEGEHFIWGAGLYRKLRGKTPILMHFNGPIYSIYEHGSLFKAISPQKKSLSAKFSGWIRRVFEKNIGVNWANYIDMFDADSPIMKKWHADFGLKNIVVLPDFVDLKQYLEYRPKKHHPLNEKTTIIYTGRLVPEKGVDDLLKAISEIKEKNKIIVRIVGGGRQEKDLMNLSHKYKIEDVVVFYPWSDKESLASLYHSSDFFVHPARWAEPFGVTIPEAMASGLPVIIPEIGGPSWSAGDAGLIFKNGDHKDLKEKIERLINDKKLRSTLAKRARVRAKIFDYRNYIRPLEKIMYNLTLNGK